MTEGNTRTVTMMRYFSSHRRRKIDVCLLSLNVCARKTSQII